MNLRTALKVALIAETVVAAVLMLVFIILVLFGLPAVENIAAGNAGEHTGTDEILNASYVMAGLGIMGLVPSLLAVTTGIVGLFSLNLQIAETFRFLCGVNFFLAVFSLWETTSAQGYPIALLPCAFFLLLVVLSLMVERGTASVEAQQDSL